ncbi:MoaB/Mog domain-containing protein [Zychaea mexicana]|uniref:MoaB/Mog domain-containing protein n=1 Tax=Zychaea mexicana TaxID=64656 RepID=UPI0022FDBFB8|nr:MoaB/Mog domain-containing protein [Zychaea mexicana]KAI9492942.1 MoaB/Mog domain-containing protein [Zychaea mexicana]
MAAENDTPSMYTVGILTVSDTSSIDATKDKSGPLLAELLTETRQYNVRQTAIVPDEPTPIKKTVEHWCDTMGVDLVLITGGTGFSPRDQTPEAVTPLLDRLTPGITHVLLASSVAVTPFAALSRPVTGIRKKTLVISFPGSPKACKENLMAILNILPHGMDLLKDQPPSSSKKHSGHHHGHHHHHHKGHACVHRSDTHGQHESRSVSLDAPVSQRARTSPYPIIPVDEAEKLVADNAHLTDIVSVRVSQQLLGHVLAEDVEAVEAVPGYRASIVDGYAVRASQGPGIYTVGSVSLASDNDDSSSSSSRIPHDHIVRIATGGMVPAEMDAVVMVEDTRLVEVSEDGKEEKRVEILAKSITSGENIREIGSDCDIGTVVGYKGQNISLVGGELGVLASVGIRQVQVYRKPRVGVLSTGNEVVDHVSTAQLKQGEIRDTNRITLLGAIKTAGFEAIDLGIIKDKVHDIESRLREALEQVDVLITTGGVSMGEADFMKPVLEQKIGAKIHFGRVKMKPGKPTTFATRDSDNKLIFALPGNPASAIVTFYLFVLPGLRKMAGYAQHENPVIPVEITDDVSLDPRPEYHRVRVSIVGNRFIAGSTGGQRSSRMLSLRQANGLLKLPAWTEGKQKLAKGETVPCVLIGPLNPSA